MIKPKTAISPFLQYCISTTVYTTNLHTGMKIIIANNFKNLEYFIVVVAYLVAI